MKYNVNLLNLTSLVSLKRVQELKNYWMKTWCIFSAHFQKAHVFSPEKNLSSIYLWSVLISRYLDTILLIDVIGLLESGIR